MIAFAIDQQPYLQGYLPVVILTNLARYGVVPGNSINSGPGFVTKGNIALVENTPANTAKLKGRQAAALWRGGLPPLPLQLTRSRTPKGKR